MVLLRTISLLLASSLAAAATLAQAAETAGPPPRIFERFDSNNDGMLTESEIARRTQKRFKRLDRNGDASIDEAELKSYFDARAGKKKGSADASAKGRDAGRLLKKYDTDGNGKVSLSEYTAVSLSRMLRADTNADKIVSVAEYVARKPGKGADDDEAEDLKAEEADEPTEE
jgi:hypothetical protein